MNLLALRLFNQHLTGKKFTKPEDVVSYFGAVQSQDYPAAKWSLGLRLAHPTDETIEQAFNEGRILRTHVLRPTWHFVVPEDIQAFLALSAPRIKQLTAYYNRRLGLTEDVFKKTNTLITKSLQGHAYLTRQEIKTVLQQEGIATDVQKLGHIVMQAEIDGIISSGPKRGKQFTYALLEERIPQMKALTRDEALARLAKKYVTSHGPVQVKDFAWWSGLSMKDATEGLQMIASTLDHMELDGKTYWFTRGLATDASEKGIYLVSVYDEYFIAYADRSSILEEAYKDTLPIGNALLTSLLIIDGKVAGTWKKVKTKDGLSLHILPFETLSRKQEGEIWKIGGAYGRFFGVDVRVVI